MQFMCKLTKSLPHTKHDAESSSAPPPVKKNPASAIFVAEQFWPSLYCQFLNVLSRSSSTNLRSSMRFVVIFALDTSSSLATFFVTIALFNLAIGALRIKLLRLLTKIYRISYEIPTEIFKLNLSVGNVCINFSCYFCSFSCQQRTWKITSFYSKSS